MSKRALTIGLGAFADPLLHAVQKAFEPNASQLTPLRLLSPLAATTPAGLEAESLTLPLDRRALSQLYFDADVRSWSAPNWIDWGGALWSNRLMGRLCAYHHHDSITEWVTDHLTRASQRDDLTIYLLAPLHDPFASGALVDIAYLLHSIALKHRAKLYGVLVLPGSEGDPVTAQDGYRTEEESSQEQREAVIQTTKFRRATAYAALRELNFISSPYAFMPTRNFNDSLRQAGHLSPFTSGDCYIVGGETREDNTPLPYTTLAEETARFILLRTISKLGDHLSQSRKDSPLFSTFCAADQQVAATEDLRRSRNTDDLSLRRAQYAVLNHLKQLDLSANTGGFIDMALIPLPSAEPTGGGLARAEQPVSADRGDIREALLGDESRYQRDIDTFREMARNLSEASQNQLRGLFNGWRAQFQTLIAQPNMTLPGLMQTIESARRVLNEQYVVYEKASEDIEREALAEAGRMSAARTQYFHLMQGGSQPLFLIVSLVFIGTVTVLLWGLGQGFLTLIWLGVAIFVPWIASSWIRRQRETAVTTRLGDARNAFLGLQSEVAQRRALSAHFYEITQRFTHEIAAPTQRMAAVLDALLREVEDVSVSAAGNNAPEIKLTPLASDVLARIHRGESVSDILGVLKTQILEQQLRRDASAQSVNSLSQITKDAQKTSPMLPLIDSQISEQDRNNTLTLIGISHFGPTLIEQLRENRSQNSQEQQNVNFYDLTDDLGGDQADQRLYVIRQRINVPLRALLSLPDLQEAYAQQSSETHNNQTVLHRAFFHPTRWGVATPDLLRHPPEIVRSLPNFVPLLVITLRLASESEPADFGMTQEFRAVNLDQAGQVVRATGQVKSMIHQLCQRLGVIWQPDIDYDALCGALHESPEWVNQLTQKNKGQPSVSLDRGGDILEIARERAKSAPPAVSEKYADWEVAAARQLVALNPDAPSSAHRILQRVAANFGIAHTFDDLV